MESHFCPVVTMGPLVLINCNIIALKTILSTEDRVAAREMRNNHLNVIMYTNSPTVHAASVTAKLYTHAKLTV